MRWRRRFDGVHSSLLHCELIFVTCSVACIFLAAPVSSMHHGVQRELQEQVELANVWMHLR